MYMKTDNEQEQVSQHRWCETERTESPLLVPVNASYSCTTTSAAAGNNNCVQSEDAGC